jgi:hypothetical protein
MGKRDGHGIEEHQGCGGDEQQTFHGCFLLVI